MTLMGTRSNRTAPTTLPRLEFLNFYIDITMNWICLDKAIRCENKLVVSTLGVEVERHLLQLLCIVYSSQYHVVQILKFGTLAATLPRIFSLYSLILGTLTND